MIDNIIFTGNVVAPVFLIVALGYFVKRLGVINENFVDVTSKFVFSVSLPALVFINIATIDLNKAIDFNQIIYICIATTITFFIIWLSSIPFIKGKKPSPGNKKSRKTKFFSPFLLNFTCTNKKGLTVLSSCQPFKLLQ